jgi:hypothetical protein
LPMRADSPKPRTMEKVRIQSAVLVWGYLGPKKQHARPVRRRAGKIPAGEDLVVYAGDFYPSIVMLQS